MNSIVLIIICGFIILSLICYVSYQHTEIIIWKEMDKYNGKTINELNETIKSQRGYILALEELNENEHTKSKK